MRRLTVQSDGWELVDEVVKTFIARHPMDWIVWKQAMARRRAGLIDRDFAEISNSRNPLDRLAISLPEFQKINKKGDPDFDGLHIYLKKVKPDIFKDKKVLREFMRRYPVFVVGNKT